MALFYVRILREVNVYFVEKRRHPEDLDTNDQVCSKKHRHDPIDSSGDTLHSSLGLTFAHEPSISADESLVTKAQLSPNKTIDALLKSSPSVRMTQLGQSKVDRVLSPVENSHKGSTNVTCSGQPIKLKSVTEPKITKRTARKTVNKTKLVSKEAEMVRKYKAQMESETKGIPLPNESIVAAENTALVLNTLSNPALPATKVAALHPACHIVKNVPKETGITNQVPDTSTLKPVMTSEKVKPIGSELIASQIVDTDSCSAVKITELKTEPNDKVVCNTSAFESADLNSILSAAGFKETDCSDTVGTGRCSSSPSASSALSPVSDVSKWNKSIDRYTADTEQKLGNSLKELTSEGWCLSK